MSRIARLFSIALCATAALCFGCSEISDPVSPSYKTELQEATVTSSPFQELFPLHYQTYLRNDEDTIMTEYKGSVPYRKNDNVNPLPKGYKNAQPYLKNLWLGYPFSYEYNETRGHTYALTDVLEIDRVNRYSEQAGLPSTCYNCKTPKMIEWVGEHGDGFWAMEFHGFRAELDPRDHSIGCANCHDPKTMDLRIVSVPLNDYLATVNRDPETLSRNEMRSLVCAQCHVEYYFTDPKFGPAAKPVFPWARGFDFEEMYEYYKDFGTTSSPGMEGWFTDWIHAVSNTPMLKAQHPEYEMFIDGTHGAAGVACADCHMPYTRIDGKRKISNHHWTSPLKTPEGVNAACRTCHMDKSAEYLKERVVSTQKRVFEQLLLAQEISVRAHEAIRQAGEWAGEKAPDYEALMARARERCRRGQWLWDMVSAENSVGFHNPPKALEALANSRRYSQEAVEYAMRATGFGIGPTMAGDIKEIVPPILEHSRKLQQCPDHLGSHPWLGYLPQLPEADLVWDLNRRMGGTPGAQPAH
jgi:nitrite reductase (cytochrome c-552)